MLHEIKSMGEGLLWWSSIKNPCCHAGNMSSIPGEGNKIPHAKEHLGPCATTREPTLQQMISCAATNTQYSQNIYIYYIFIYKFYIYIYILYLYIKCRREQRRKPMALCWKRKKIRIRGRH